MKWKLGLPYLTKAERSNFQLLVENGEISFFQITSCEHCKGDVPIIKDDDGQQIKRYCSVACFEEGEEDGEQEEETDDNWFLD